MMMQQIAGNIANIAGQDVEVPHFIPDVDPCESSGRHGTTRQSSTINCLKKRSRQDVSADGPPVYFQNTRAELKITPRLKKDYLQAFQQAGNISLAVGSTIVMKEANAIRQRLAAFQTSGSCGNMQVDEDTTQARKRRKMNESNPSLAKCLPNPQKEKQALWQRTLRMKRMSVALKNLEIMQRNLLKDMQDIAKEELHSARIN